MQSLHSPAGLVADIGGTNARFGWVAPGGSSVEQVHTLPVAAHAGPAEAVLAYLALLRPALGERYAAPRRAAFALATVVDGDRVEMTNSHWRFSRAELRAMLGLERLLLLNDFEALALALPRLQAPQLRAWDGAAPPARPAGTLAVIGPGTGLGVAGVTRAGAGWLALPGEGGHMTLAAMDDFEEALLGFVRRQRYPHVSAERLLSGMGLPLLHEAVAAVLGRAQAPLTAAAIVEAGLGGGDAVAERTLDSFCALLGGFAGNVALTLGARGGVYIGGGIVPRLGEYFFRSRFRERFEAKGRFGSYLAPIPTLLILDTLVALGGAALALEQDRA
ncbi:glucokinase [Roseateles sp. DAIF2]|uniref:glucokinase n=1 Tax=Roseateles sp. DAIF2 TaxID=2714952 RepID=UPI0018A2F055|nr:glucokinase [Roseateles sp. DAIF2]QPF74578.1 glucokinase [Roseateles sp. DAIF2]